jgi:hypothetical protein
MATIRTTVNLPEDEYDALKALAGRRQISFTHGLRQAIQSELFIQSLVDQGTKLLVQDQHGDMQQLVFTQAADPATATASVGAAHAQPVGAEPAGAGA